MSENCVGHAAISRSHASSTRSGSVRTERAITLQIVRDWVLRFNAEAARRADRPQGAREDGAAAGGASYGARGGRRATGAIFSPRCASERLSASARKWPRARACLFVPPRMAKASAGSSSEPFSCPAANSPWSRSRTSSRLFRGAGHRPPARPPGCGRRVGRFGVVAVRAA